MRQTVQVTAIPSPGMAEVTVERRSACSGDCHSCGGCSAYTQRMTVVAENPIGAVPGDRVVVETSTGTVMAAAALVYLVPLATFFLGYCMGELLSVRPALSGIVGFVLGLIPALLMNRIKKRETGFKITQFAQD